MANKALRMELCEQRVMFIAPTLIAVIPNVGDIIRDNDVLHVAPQQLTLRFDEGQVIDANTLNAIQLTRSNHDDLFDANDLPVTFGFIGIGDNSNEVVVRFDKTLPDDKYQIKVTGSLRNAQGEAFQNGTDFTRPFFLDLGAQIISVVPQPVSRDAQGKLTQAVDQIDVYFNNDDLNPTSATNTTFYELIRTGDTATNVDDVIIHPSSVAYDPAIDKAVLTFAPGVLSTPATYRLRIGNNDALPLQPDLRTPATDPGSSFTTATDLLNVGTQPQGLQSLIVTAAIEPQTYTLPFPGDNNDPGHRQIPPVIENHFAVGVPSTDPTPDTTGGVPTFTYGFPSQVSGFFNFITENQKQRAREVFEFYSNYLGVQFVENTDRFPLVLPQITVMTGDLALFLLISEPGGLLGSFSGQATTGDGIALMDNAELWDDRGPEQRPTGALARDSWFQTAMHEIGHVLGLGDSYDLPLLTIQGSSETQRVPTTAAATAELVFPGDADILHGQHLFRPDVIDIDMYKFNLVREGRLTLETIAERLNEPSRPTSQLDTLITVFDANRNVVARNDDYFSEDSFLSLDLAAGQYFVGVSASGNDQYDPAIENTGIGGRTQGVYDLRLNFSPRITAQANNLVDIDATVLDGNADGLAGGAYNFWFRVANADDTLFVDKATTGGAGPLGSIANPFNNVSLAMASANNGDVVRIEGNGGADGNLATLADNLAYNVGYDILNNPLSDGATMEVPQGVTVMIDAGAIFKMRAANIETGSNSQGLDRSRGALMVLGTPARDAQGTEVGIVRFTSYHNESTGLDTDPRPTSPALGDWGGLVYREDSDREQDGIFLNYVNHANLTFGGGNVVVNSVQQVYNPIHMVDARPSVSFNSITSSADAAMSANPNSFEDSQFQDRTFVADYGRIGPDIHGNTTTGNSINALFIRVQTLAGQNLDPLTTVARFDDTDIVHYLPEVLEIQGTPGGPQIIVDPNVSPNPRLEARLDARLSIDPGIILKLDGSRIETGIGAQFLAEGTAENRIIFTSSLDDRFGGSGTFDTTNDGGNSLPNPGDWGGIYFGHLSSGSIDHALITYGGGAATIEGAFDNFNAVEIHQADVRIASSILERNDNGLAQSERVGRGINDEAVILIRGAQPVILNNTFQNNLGLRSAAISVNASALNSTLLPDYGRSTGQADILGDFIRNAGPLIHGNRLANNTINGMVVRGGTLTTQTIWDDADIVHVVQDEIISPDHHTLSSMRLFSSDESSLVVKFDGAAAGLTASGRPLDINDRIGGTVQIVGTPNHPVVFTSIADDTAGTGLDPKGRPQTDTNNDGNQTSPTPGDWRSIRLDRYSNDRNVQIYNEVEVDFAASGDRNGLPTIAELVGSLAPNEKSGDDILRLGYEIHGTLISTSDVDVYSFKAKAGTEVWLDVDRTSQALDAVVELVDANGSVIVRSNNSPDETQNASLLVGNSALLMQRSEFQGQDFYTTNPLDPGVRVLLPGISGSTNTYYVRVRSSSANLAQLTGGLTRGVYQLQLRLQEADEVPGSTIRYADIRYAVNGIEILGKPEHSPLLGESAESTANNDTRGNAQDLGNLLTTDRGTLAVAGNLDARRTDIDWYSFTLSYDQVQRPGLADIFSTILDLDYADGMGRPDIQLYVYDDAANLIYVGNGSNVTDDLPGPLEGADTDDLSRGSFGVGDPLLGSINMLEGGTRTYYVAVAPLSRTPNELRNNPLARLEPVNSVARVAEDHIGSTDGMTGGSTRPLFPGGSATQLNLNADAYHLGDVVLYVSDGTDLYTVDPYTGFVESDVTGVQPYGPGKLPNTLSNPFVTYQDISLRNDGRLYTLTTDTFSVNGDHNAISGNYRELNIGDGRLEINTDDTIITYTPDPMNPIGMNGMYNLVRFNAGVQFDALAHVPGFGRGLFAVGHVPASIILPEIPNLLYALDRDGVVIDDPADMNPDDARLATDATERGALRTAPTLSLLLDPVIAQQTGATDIVFPFTGPGDVIDGTRFSVAHVDPLTMTPITLVFEMDSGPDVRLDRFGAALVRDGQNFTLSDGTLTRNFEFDSGAVLVLAGGGGQMKDGDTFTIADNATPQKAATFEFDNDGVTVGGNIVIPFDVTDSALAIRTRVIAAINSSGTAVVASANPAPGLEARITLINDTNIQLGTTTTSVRIEGLAGLNPRLAISDVTVVEGNAGTTNAVFTVTRTVNVNQQVTVGFSTANGTATAGSDFANATGTLTFAPGVTTRQITVQINGDATVEPSETYTVNLANVQNGIIIDATGFGRIINDDGPNATVFANNVTVNEGLGGITNMVFTVSLAGPAPQPVTVNFATANGTATAGSDYVDRTGALTFNPGTTQQQVTIAVLGDATNEADETFTLNLTGAVGATVATSSITGTIANDDGVDLNPVPILFEETDLAVPFGTAVVTAVTNVLAPIRAGFAARTGDPNPPGTDGDRLTFYGALLADFSGVPSFRVANDRDGQPSATGISPTSNIAVPFDADDLAIDIYRGIEAAVNQAQAIFPLFQVTARAIGNGVEIIGAEAFNATLVDTPFNGQGEGPGGDITGMTFIGNDLYAVSDAGGLYRVINRNLYNNGASPGASLEYIPSSAAFLTGIPFSGLDAGPANVEPIPGTNPPVGRYANMLFASDSDGNLYAFNTMGELQNVFGGNSTVSVRFDPGDPLTTLAGLTGLTFSPVDYNLWHVTNQRGADPRQVPADAGHGIGPAPDLSRRYGPPADIRVAPGGTSFYFGFEDPRLATTISTQPGAVNFTDPDPGNEGVHRDDNEPAFRTYNLPGGAYGSLTTDLFSLKGYSAADQPVMYYNYFYGAETETFFDTFKVYISEDGANWTLLQANPARNAGGWRQSRLSLGAFAGFENLRLRFDFSTAGEMHVGDSGGDGSFPDGGSLYTTGAIMRAIPGRDLRDGDSYVIDTQAFEFDMGFSLLAPTAAGFAIPDGETFTITGPGGTVTFEFNKSGGVTIGNRAVSIANDDSANTVAAKIAGAVTASGVLGAGATPVVLDNRVNLPGATDVFRSPLARMTQEGDAPGVVTALGAVPIPVTPTSTAVQVAAAIGAAIDAAFIAGAGNVDDPTFVDTVKVDRTLIHVINHVVLFPGPLPFSNFLPNDHVALPGPPRVVDADRFVPYGQNQRGQNNALEGFYLDDVIIGFAERGEMVTGATGDDTFFTLNPLPAVTLVGAYDLEIRQGTEYATFVPNSDAGGNPTPFTLLQLDFDTNDRMASVFTLRTLPGGAIHEGESFTISDGVNPVTFEFDTNNAVGPGHVKVPFAGTDSDDLIATNIANAINTRSLINPLFKVHASTTLTRNTVELAGAASVDDVASPGVSHFSVDGLYYGAAGDTNTVRDQGYTLVQSNRVSNSSEFGILVNATPRTVGDSLPHPGTVRNLREINSQRLVPGILLENNLLVQNADGGIRFSGDNSATGPAAAVAFGRIINNTIYGGTAASGVGIQVDQNSSPTILNNVIANSATGVNVDNTSATSVLGANVYQGNGTNRTLPGGLIELRNIDLAAGDPLFVSPATGNFYLRQGALAIDSSLNSLQERPALQTVSDPLGIPVSPILAPELDLFGQLRVDDPAVSSPPGLGPNVFKDRGAIDRADFIGPSASLVNPADNDSAGIDEDPALHQVRVTGQTVTNFAIQFADGTGIGVADNTIDVNVFTVTVDDGTGPRPLAETTDFLFSYDATNNIARFDAAAGLYLDGIYHFVVAATVTDLANNALRPNQPGGTIEFTIVLAPAPLHPWQNPTNSLDVNNDTFVVALDALIVINALNAGGAGPLPLPATPPPYFDVNGDGQLSPLDALIIINFLNNQSAAAPAALPMGAALEAPLADEEPVDRLAGPVAAGKEPPQKDARPAALVDAAAVAAVLADEDFDAAGFGAGDDLWADDELRAGDGAIAADFGDPLGMNDLLA